MELHEALSSLAENLREERTRAGLTLEQVALRADLSTVHLSRLESGDRQPSVAALISLSRALGVSMSTLLGERRDVPAIGVSPPGRMTHEANGLTMAPCSGFPGSSTLEALQISIRADRAPSEPARHRGEEWIYVVAGQLRLEFDGQVHVVEAGATAHFDANRPHRLGTEQGVVDLIIVAADVPNDFRNHPLFSASISDH